MLPKMHWWDQGSIGITIPKGRNRKGWKERVMCPKQAKTQQGKSHYIVSLRKAKYEYINFI